MRALLLLIMAFTFSQPVRFAAALESREVRSLLRTTLSSAEIREGIINNPALGQDFIDHAVFSARMANAQFLQEIDDVTRDIVDGKIGHAEAERRLRDVLTQIGYVPSAEAKGTLQDFTTSERLDLIIETNAGIAQGYGQWIQGQTPNVLDFYPCQELFRLGHRKVERGSALAKSNTAKQGWDVRWQDCGGEFYGENNDRMIARKDSKVWARLGTWGDDSLGNPYPPFAFNSGMWVKDVRRSVAIKLGVITAEEAAPKPQSKGFNDDLRFTPKIRNEALLQALIESLGPGFEIVDGVLTLA